MNFGAWILNVICCLLLGAFNLSTEKLKLSQINLDEMAEKGETKIITIITINIILITILMSGCISTEFLSPPEESTKHPDKAVIAVDDNSTAYIIWNIYENDYKDNLHK